MKTPHTLLALLSSVLFMELGAQAPATFEVVSIKRSVSTEGAGGSVILPGGRYTATNVPVILLLDIAYRIPPERIVGGPAWMRTDRYNIEARAERDAPPDGMPQMMQGLLRDRFQLKAHVEQRDTPIYALNVARAGGTLGPGLRPATFDCSNMENAKKGLATVSADGVPGCGQRRAPGRFFAGSVSLDSLQDALAPAAGRPVVNRTNLTGRYDVRLEWATAPGDPDGVSIFTAVQEQLGLRLESQTALLDVLVVDSIERPTEN